MSGSMPKPKMSMMPRWRMELVTRASLNSSRERTLSVLSGRRILMAALRPMTGCSPS